MYRDRNSKTYSVVNSSIIFLLVLYSVHTVVQGGESDLRTYGVSVLFGLPEYVSVSGIYQLSRSNAVGVKLSRMIIGHDSEMFGFREGCLFFCGLIRATTISASYTYYFARDLYDRILPNAMVFDAGYIIPLRRNFTNYHSGYRGVFTQVMFRWEDISKPGLVPCWSIGVNVMATQGLEPLVFPVANFGFSYNF